MSVLWTGDALVAGVGGRPIGQVPAEITGISIDTRTLEPGDAFFAIKGESFDGHDFATAAIKAGAGVLVVSEGRLPALGRLTVPMIVVDDVLKGLERLAVASRARSSARIIAVTGSAGKTSTKEALRSALAVAGSVHASEKSFNNHWGVPLTLAKMPADTAFGVFEIGMNHPDEIRPLVKLVRPHVAIVTLIAAAHLGHFRDLDEIADAKAEIFEGVEPDGHALINRDDARFQRLADAAKAAGVGSIKGFGEDELADHRLLPDEGELDPQAFRCWIDGRERRVGLGAPGRHMVQNALAVLGAAELVGVDVDRAAEALSAIEAEPGRGRQHQLSLEGGAVRLIDESYNANPASIKAALALLAATPVGEGGRRIAVLGDMKELGTFSADLHAAIADDIGEAIGPVYLGGPEMKALAVRLDGRSDVVWRESTDALMAELLPALRPGDAVMVKSSKSTGFSRIVAELLARHGEKSA